MNDLKIQLTPPPKLQFISPVEKFDEKYECVNKIGEGAHGVVFKVRYRKTGQIFAAKIIRTDDIEISQQIKTEFEIMTLLNHQNIVRACEFFEQTGIHYIIMEYLDNKLYSNFSVTIAQIKKDKEEKKDMRKKSEKWKYIIKQIFEAAQYMHKNGIIHRDLQPSNIFIHTESLLVKILDFGVAKNISICEKNNKNDDLTYQQIYQQYISSNNLNDVLKHLSQTKAKQNGLDVEEIMRIEEYIHKKNKQDQKEEIAVLTPTGAPAFQPIRGMAAYNEKIDVWGIGLLIAHFKRQNAVTSFEAIDIIAKIRIKPLDTRTDYEDLLLQCLEENQLLRINCDQALKHKWFKHSPLL